MRAAPAIRAPWITAWPTPPQPITATLDPGSTSAVLSAAPTPVVTPQPISASWSSGRSVSTFTACDSEIVIASENVPRPVKPGTGVPSARFARGTIITAPVCSQRFDWPWTQYQQAPHAGTNVETTRSPVFTWLTSDPTQSTVPAPSWPRIVGGGSGNVPLVTDRSEWHTPLAPISTTTSPGPGSRAVISSTIRGWSCSTYTAALMESPSSVFPDATYTASSRAGGVGSVGEYRRGGLHESSGVRRAGPAPDRRGDDGSGSRARRRRGRDRCERRVPLGPVGHQRHIAAATPDDSGPRGRGPPRLRLGRGQPGEDGRPGGLH